MSEQTFLAVDLGASGGRCLAGHFDGARLRIEELHRFDNGPVAAAGVLQWDVLRLWTEIQAGLRIAAQRFGSNVKSIGVDTWGVDFGLLGRGDTLLANPYCYRDPRWPAQQADQSHSDAGRNRRVRQYPEPFSAHCRYP